jgi:hypothetical protein
MKISNTETAKRIKNLENWPKLLRFPVSETFNQDNRINCISVEEAAILLDTSAEHLIAVLENVGTDEKFPDATMLLENSETGNISHVITVERSRRIAGGRVMCFTGKSAPINGVSFLASYEIESLGYTQIQSKKGA